MVMEERSACFIDGVSELANNTSVSISFHLDGWPAAVSIIGTVAIVSAVYLATHKPNTLVAA